MTNTRYKGARWRILATGLTGANKEARYYLFKSESSYKVRNRYKVVFVSTDPAIKCKKRSRYYKTKPSQRAFEFMGW